MTKILSFGQFFTVFIIIFLADAQNPSEWTPWLPPWHNYKNNVNVRTLYGDIEGFTIPWTVDDTLWHPDYGGNPWWVTRRVNCFLGVPFAAPPVGDLRFQRPERPRWDGLWLAKHYRHACPQDLAEVRKDIPDFPPANMSEDCLYLNIFAPNKSDGNLQPIKVFYPVMVFFHGGDWTYGNSQQTPGHVMVTRDMVVVTVNYRLGALGFLSTEDENAPGNWGLFDQQLALEFVKNNIRLFGGDENRITIAGEGAGGASVGIHMISPYTKGKGFFQQAIMMSGFDLSPWGTVDPFWRPRDYAKRLAVELQCPEPDDTLMLVRCLRDTSKRPWQEVLRAQQTIKPYDGVLGIVWGPVQDDGGWLTHLNNRYSSYLPATPRDIRLNAKDVDHIPLMAGINSQDGTDLAHKTVRGLEAGMLKSTFKHFINQQLKDWHTNELYRTRSAEALEFQYTWWAEPENKSARTQEFINLITDYQVGAPMDATVKQHSSLETTFMYIFNYRSWNYYLPNWMGCADSAASRYAFGVPFMNETVLNETYLQPRQWYDYEDRNMSDFVMGMWVNFAKYGDPTPNITRNITWEPYNLHNLSFLLIDWWSYNWYRYRQTKYGFWREYFPTVAKQDYLFPTATPTPRGYQYVEATGAMSAVWFILLVTVGVCAFLLYQQSREEENKEYYTESEIPLSFGAGGRSASHSTVRTRSPDSGGYNTGQSGPYSFGQSNV